METPTTPRTARMAITSALVAIGLVVTTLVASPSYAMVADAHNGKATVYLSQYETEALANGRIPKVVGLAGPLAAAYYALTYTHKFLAKQYAKKHWCSAFTLNIRPWATQGYYGYKCNWK